MFQRVYDKLGDDQSETYGVARKGLVSRVPQRAPSTLVRRNHRFRQALAKPLKIRTDFDSAAEIHLTQLLLHRRDGDDALVSIQEMKTGFIRPDSAQFEQAGCSR